MLLIIVSHLYSCVAIGHGREARPDYQQMHNTFI